MQRTAASSLPVSRPQHVRWAWGAVLAVALGGGVFWNNFRAPAPPVEQQAAPVIETRVEARPTQWEVVNSYPHDPQAFLQGLVWHDGGFYASTGLEGRSSLRRVAFPSGKVLQKRNLPPDVFGEGVDLFDDRLIQLTWQSRKGYVYDRKTFQLQREWNYQTEGWGLTNDGEHLIMSDGSDTLFYRDPQSFNLVRELKVTMNGKPLRALNELEWIEGEIWANVWQTDYIVRIDPRSGAVTSYLNLKGLLPANVRTGREDVLNGIAYDKATKRIFVSGKLWPRLFHIRIEELS
jgi:glutamine cyclotransferase